MVLGLLLLMADVAQAGSECSNPRGCTFVIGAGRYSCGKLIAALGKAPPGKQEYMNTAIGVFIDEHSEYQEWLMGFVTGYNFAYSGPGNEQKAQIEIDQAGADLWMRNWCNQHPTLKVFDGAMFSSRRCGATRQQGSAERQAQTCEGQNEPARIDSRISEGDADKKRPRRGWHTRARAALPNGTWGYQSQRAVQHTKFLVVRPCSFNRP
jgi:hypothetical protein